MTTTLAQAHAWANSPTHERSRAEAMGFEFSAVEVKEWHYDGFEIRGTFMCVCGQREYYYFVVGMYEDHIRQAFDIGAKLRRIGSFSKEHFLEDGYSPQAVAEMLAKGVAFDRREQGYEYQTLSLQHASQSHSETAQEAMWRLSMGTPRAAWMARPVDSRAMARRGTRGK